MTISASAQTEGTIMSDERTVKRDDLLTELFKTWGSHIKNKVNAKVDNRKKSMQRVLKSEAAGIFQKEYFKNFRVHEVGKGAYVITEALFTNCFLFVGEKEALLIDTGLGIKGLKELTEELADGKPVRVVCTSSSPWSVGGAGQFGKVEIAHEDRKVAKLNNKYLLRKWMFRADPFRYALKLSDSDLISETASFTDLDYKKDIDLGGRTVEVVHTPSQTPGACCFKDKETSTVVSGDVTAPVSIMIYPRSVSLTQYGYSIDSVERMCSDLKHNYTKHFPEPIHDPYTADLRILVKGLGDGFNDHSTAAAVRHTNGFHRLLIYSPYKINQKNIKKKLENIYHDD